MYDRHHHSNHKEATDRHDDNPYKLRRASLRCSLFRQFLSRFWSIVELFNGQVEDTLSVPRLITMTLSNLRKNLKSVF